MRVGSRHWPALRRVGEPASDVIDRVISGPNRIEIDFDPSRAISAHSVVATDVLYAVTRHARFGVRRLILSSVPRERVALCDWPRRSPPDRQPDPGRRARQMARRGLAQDRAAGKARCSQTLAEASSRGSAAGSSHNEVAHTCQTGAFGQMSGRRCFSVRERTTCSIKLWPR